ncbi:hypothetical protein [Agriterribacter humi]|jgi:hypothetical protein|uniref:hypothetical protein n=1 Tax=Agriterribacter humi TaxID=1104781 RepID=UPI00126528E9|nr:hypothetical protein [Agriterribacter humi]
MRKIPLIALLIMIIICSCSTTRYYTYDIRLEKPAPSTRLFFENDTMSLSFQFKPRYIEFETYNKLEDGIRINWDELSISVNGDAKRIVHYETGENKITETQPPTTIPPKSKLVDGVIPTENIKYIISSGKRILLPLYTYPISDNGSKKTKKKILTMKGQKTVFYFPYYLKGVYHSKTFEFLIADVVQRKKK